MMIDHIPIKALWILMDDKTNCDKKFKVKYHHDLSSDKHFISGGITQWR
jgi:hypothetical protein